VEALPVGLGQVGLDPQIPLMTKPVKCHNCKTKDSRFLKMENNLIVEAVSKFVTTPVLPSIAVVLVISAPPVSTLNLVSGFTQSVPTIAKVPTSCADVSFLHKGFLDPSSSAG
jgi:hypothetical protein